MNLVIVTFSHEILTSNLIFFSHLYCSRPSLVLVIQFDHLEKFAVRRQRLRMGYRPRIVIQRFLLSNRRGGHECWAIKGVESVTSEFC